MKTSFFSKKTVTIIIGLLLLFVLAIAGFFIFFHKSKPNELVVAIYKMGDKPSLMLQKEILALKDIIKSDISILIPDGSEPVDAKFLKKNRVDILISEFTLFPDSAQSLLKAPESSILASMPSSLRSSIPGMGAYQNSVPLMANHFELAAHRPSLKAINMPFPEKLENLERTAQALKANIPWPILVAGGDDYQLGLFLGALIEAQFGLAGWKLVSYAFVLDAAENKGEQGQNGNAILSSSMSAEPFVETIRLLRSWEEKGFLHPEWLSLKTTDLINFMENRIAGFVFMDLLTHRNIDMRTINQYDSSYISSNRKLQSRSFTTPVYSAFLLTSGKQETTATKLLKTLVSDAYQEKLGAVSGLAPVTLSAIPIDSQADDARFLLAASEYPLGNILYSSGSDEAAKKIAKAIREQLAER